MATVPLYLGSSIPKQCIILSICCGACLAIKRHNLNPCKIAVKSGSMILLVVATQARYGLRVHRNPKALAILAFNGNHVFSLMSSASTPCRHCGKTPLAMSLDLNSRDRGRCSIQASLRKPSVQRRFLTFACLFKRLSHRRLQIFLRQRFLNEATVNLKGSSHVHAGMNSVCPTP